MSSIIKQVEAPVYGVKLPGERGGSHLTAIPCQIKFTSFISLVDHASSANKLTEVIKRGNWARKSIWVQ